MTTHTYQNYNLLKAFAWFFTGISTILFVAQLLIAAISLTVRFLAGNKKSANS